MDRQTFIEGLKWDCKVWSHCLPHSSIVPEQEVVTLYLISCLSWTDWLAVLSLTSPIVHFGVSSSTPNTYVSCPFSGCTTVSRKSRSMCCDCEDMTSYFVLSMKTLSPSITHGSPPVDSFLVNTQCHVPRHKVPHFKVKMLKQWGGSGSPRTGHFISQYVKPQLEDWEQTFMVYNIDNTNPTTIQH